MLTVLISFLSFAIISDTTSNKSKPVELDPIVVVGQREPVRLSKAINSVIKVSPKKVQNASEDNIISFLLDNNASISISSVSAVGFGLGSRGQGRLLIRGLGFSPNRGALVLIDGRPDIAGLFGHPLPDTYRRAGLYSAELVKGGASTLYGSNAIAGVLDLESFYRPDVKRYTNLELSGGSYNTVDGIIQHSQKVGKAVVAGWYEYVESDNARVNNEYFNRSGGFRLQFDDVSDYRIFLSGRYTSFNFSDPGPEYNPSRATGDIRRSGVTLGIDKKTERYSFSTRLYNSYGEHTFSDGFNSIDRNNGVDLFAKVKHVGWKELSLSGGISFNELGGSAYDGTPFINKGNFDETEFAGHLQTELKVENIFSFIVGGRYIHHSRYDDHFVYQVGAVVSPDRYGSFKFSVGKAYRNPTINETQLFLISNPDSLKPEEGTFYEIGYFNRLNYNISVEGTVFWRDGDNLITTLPNPSPPPMVEFQNSGNYHHWGYEWNIRYVKNNWHLKNSFIHLHQHDYNLSVPQDKYVFSGGYHAKKLRFNLETVTVFKTASDSAGIPLTLDNYWVVNGDAKYQINSLISLNLRIENLFDEKYQIVYGYPMPGVTIRSGLALKVY